MGVVIMEYGELGGTGLRVSRLVLGTLTMGPLQANMSVDEGAGLIRHALDLGVNFFDTAEVYDTYHYLKAALRGIGDEAMVATKSFAYTWDGMKKSLEKARKGIDRDVLDVFLLHEQESAKTLEGHRPALEYLLDAKARGLVRAVGVSTHYVEVVETAAGMKEIDVIHPMLNREGLGIQGGGLDDMLAAVRRAKEAGKGIYGMKALGGGNLIKDALAALEWARDLPFVDAFAVGVTSREELEVDAMIFSREEVPSALLERVSKRKRTLLIEKWCRGCGRCVDACQFGALRLVGGRAEVDPARCVLCGYCAARCKDFFIKVI